MRLAVRAGSLSLLSMGLPLVANRRNPAGILRSNRSQGCDHTMKLSYLVPFWSAKYTIHNFFVISVGYEQN